MGTGGVYTAREDEQRVCQLDDGEAAQVLRVDDMAGHAEGAEADGEFVDEAEEDLEGYHGVYEAREELLGEDGVLFDELGEVVESGGCCWG